MGLLLSLAVVLEIFISLQHSNIINTYGIDKVVLLAPILFLLTGIILLAYRPKD